MTVSISCPISRHEIPIEVVILTSGSANFQLNHFCPECRTVYTVQQIRKMDDDVLFEVSEYERLGQLDGYEGGDFGEAA